MGQMTPAYRARMYDVIDLYDRSYNAEETVVCVDEKGKQMLTDTLSPLTLNRVPC
jgi:hypothetical protein